MTSRLPLVPALLLFAVALPAPAADWPQWRGPNRDDVSKETGLLKAWPKEGPALLWTFEDAGNGYSGPAVVGGRLISQGATDGKEYVFALDVGSGKKLWSTDFGDLFTNNWGDGPRGTPTVDGDWVYALGGQGVLVCLELATGKTVWQKDLKKDLDGQKQNNWGYTESPLVDGDKVVCMPGGPKGTLAALDKKTGEVIWRSKGLTDKAAYSSLVVSNAGGVRQYVVMTGDSVSGVTPEDGRLLWRFPRNSPTAAIPTPIVRDNFVYVSSAYNTGASLLKVTGGPDGHKAEQEWANKEMMNKHGGVVLVGDHVYGHSEKGGWVCQEFKTGNVAWVDKTFEMGSLTCADGMLYLYGQSKGNVALVEANPAKYTEVSRFTIPRQTKIRKKSGGIWTHPVVANGRLYLRDQDLIFCYDVKAQ